MKILHIIFAFPTGGTETMLVDIMNLQVAKGHDVGLMIINNLVDEKLISTIDRRVNIFRWNRKPGSGKLLLALRLNSQVRAIHPDIIHLHDPNLPGILRGMDKKLLYTVHDLTLSQRYLRPTIQQIAITEAVKQDILSLNNNAKVTVILNGINTKALKVRSKNSSNPQNGFQIIQVARLDSHKKGQDILIKALGILKLRCIPNISVDFVGEGPDLAMLRELALSEGVGNSVNFLGLKSRKEVYDLYANYDLMVHPARYEGFGLIIAEAMAAGLPVAVPYGGGPYEIIERGKYGIVFKPDDPEAIADVIEHTRNNYGQALTTASYAREKALLSYTLDATVDAYLSLYRATINQTGPD